MPIVKMRNGCQVESLDAQNTYRLKKLLLNRPTADVKEEHITITYILKNHFTTAKRIKKCISISI